MSSKDTLSSAPERLRDWVMAGAPSPDWAALGSSNDAVLRARVALNSATQPDLLGQLVNDEAWFVRWAAASRSDWVSEQRDRTLIRMATDDNSTVRLIVAVDPSCPSQVLEMLAQDPDNLVRSLAAESLSKSREEDGGSGSSSSHRMGPPWPVGKIGPAGGIVFFDAGSPQWWGQYMEAAPDGWSLGRSAMSESLDPAVAWCEDMFWEDEVDTGEEVGWGLYNTWSIMQKVGPDSAACLAASFRGGGYSDWFLPSLDELKLLHEQRDVIVKPCEEYFWSSSQREIDTEDDDVLDAWCLSFTDGYADVSLKTQECLVRPVRAF